MQLHAEVSGAFATASIPFGTVTVMSNGTLKFGSSKHGNARRASVGSNFVNAYRCAAVFGPVQPGQRLAEWRVVFDDEPGRARRKRRRESEDELLGRSSSLRRARRHRCGGCSDARALYACRLDSNVTSVKHDVGRRLGDFESMRATATEARLGRIDVEVDRVGGRARERRQASVRSRLWKRRRRGDNDGPCRRKGTAFGTCAEDGRERDRGNR